MADELTAPLALPVEDAITLLNAGELSIEGRVTTASNATLYCRVELDGVIAACVYKPVSGERPLWDYPDGTLAEREYATFVVASASGWNLVPPTVLRDGPLGTGMVQLWIADDEDYDIIAAINSGDVEQLRRMAVLDAVVNNSDRKISHLLPVTEDGALHIYGVDHGVSFGVEDRLRTVLWQWAGDEFAPETTEILDRLSIEMDGALGESLRELLTGREVRATAHRIRRLLRTRCFPMPPTDWPAIPYPPY